MRTSVFSEQSMDLLERGCCHLRGVVPEAMLADIDAECRALTGKASSILNAIQASGSTFADYYQRGAERLIAVPEADNCKEVCRFEYVAGSSSLFRDIVVPLCAEYIERLTKRKYCLLKDKCNLKSPGGGAFTAHQDALAYADFGPTIHVTAGLMLDPSTADNGALQMAHNFLRARSPNIQWHETGLGTFPSFPVYQGGRQHGRIVEDVERQLRWSSLFTKPGDLLLFNSYIPHKSEVNHSTRTRRAFFFTFNLEEEGNHYEKYYEMKRSDFANPRFHIATPTEHRASHQQSGVQGRGSAENFL